MRLPSCPCVKERGFLVNINITQYMTKTGSILLFLVSTFIHTASAKPSLNVEYTQQELPHLYTTHPTYQQSGSVLNSASVGVKLSLPRLSVASADSLAGRLLLVNQLVEEEMSLAERFPHFYMAASGIKRFHAIKQQIILNKLASQHRESMDNFLTDEEHKALKEVVDFSAQEQKISMFTIHVLNAYLAGISGNGLVGGTIPQWDESKALEVLEKAVSDAQPYEKLLLAINKETDEFLKLSSGIQSKESADERGPELGRIVASLQHLNEERQQVLNALAAKIPAIAEIADSGDNSGIPNEYHRFSEVGYFDSEVLQQALLGSLCKGTEAESPDYLAQEKALNNMAARRTGPYNAQKISDTLYTVDYHVAGYLMAPGLRGWLSYDMFYRAFIDSTTGEMEILVFDTEAEMNACTDAAKASDRNRLTNQEAFRDRLSVATNEALIKDSANYYNSNLKLNNLTPIPDFAAIHSAAVRFHENNHIDYYSGKSLFFLPPLGTFKGDCAKKHEEILIRAEGRAVIAQIDFMERQLSNRIKDPKILYKYMLIYAESMFTATIDGTKTTYHEAARRTGDLYRVTKKTTDNIAPQYSPSDEQLYKEFSKCALEYARTSSEKEFHRRFPATPTAATPTPATPPQKKKPKPYKCMSCQLGDTGLKKCINKKCVNYGKTR